MAGAVQYSYYGDEITLSLSSEIRLLPDWIRLQLGQLEQERTWKEVFAIIPRSPWTPEDPLPEDQPYLPRYSTTEIRLIFDAYNHNHQNGLEALLEEWGTSGKIRPTISTLISLLERLKLHRAVDYVKSNVLNLSPSHTTESDHESIEHHVVINSFDQYLDLNTQNNPETILSTGNNPDVGLRRTENNYNPFRNNCNNNNNSDNEHNNFPASTQDTLDIDEKKKYSLLWKSFGDSGLHHYPYDLIKEITHNFCGIPCNGGNYGKLGEGGFGSVYKGCYNDGQQTKHFAIKSFMDFEEYMKKQFMNEVVTMAKCKHNNILQLEGFSFDGPQWCLLYTLMPNGSLRDKLNTRTEASALPWVRRQYIAEGIAEGIHYLHNSFASPIVHRDIKSANILLDSDYTPKVGDFGSVRLGGDNVHTTTAIGTLPYMAPEAFRKEICTEMDVFSYGIILFELLTGLPPYDENRSGRDLLSFYEGYEGNKLNLLDAKAGQWNENVSEQMFELASKCTQEKCVRPTMNQILNILSLLKPL